MKKLILSITLLLVAIFASAQLTSTTGKFYTNYPGVDYVVIFNGITGSTEINYTGNGTSIKWYKFSNPTVSISNLPYISPEDATGYLLNVDGVVKKIWVIDYKKFLTLSDYSIDAENNPSAQCKQMKLLLKAPTMSYQTPDGVNHTMNRHFSIKYKTLKWNNTSWGQVDSVKNVTFPTTEQYINTPFCNTTFTLSGDQFAADLGLSPISVNSSQYVTKAVICKLTSNVALRDSTNEAERPSKIAQVSGSSPMDIRFYSNGNDPVPQAYNWQLTKNKNLITSSTNKDFAYTFTDAGTYRVLVTVSNNICSYSDSLIVSISTSQIQVPNVFTPNGDGYNDEFRIAYKSILTFQCWVYNRWGRQVYTWTDPMKGWNGKINGVDAQPGPYFYVIKAYGSDYDPKSTPNPVTHRRVGEYLLKGDINLLRGEK